MISTDRIEALHAAVRALNPAILGWKVNLQLSEDYP